MELADTGDTQATCCGARLQRVFRHTLAYTSLLLVVVLWVAQSEYSQWLQRRLPEHSHSFFITWFNHCWSILILPACLVYLHRHNYAPGSPDTEMAPLLIRNFVRDDQTLRPSSAASTSDSLTPPLSGRRSLRHYLAAQGFTYSSLGWMSAGLSFVFLLADYCWYIGLPSKKVSVGEATAIYNTSPAFVYLLSLAFLHERLSAHRVTVIAISLAGVVLIGVSKGSLHESLGILALVLAALFFAIYQVLFRKYAVRSNHAPLVLVNFLVGCQGLATAFLWWTGFVLLNFFKFEPFSLPDADHWKLLTLNAVMATAFNWALMLALSFNPTQMVSLCQVLTIPAGEVYDLLATDNDKLPVLSIIGTVLVVVAFCLQALIEYWHDKELFQPLIVNEQEVGSLEPVSERQRAH